MNEAVLNDAIANPRNLGEMADADAVGTVGNPECGDMVRMWLKFTEKDGRKVIDKASFQSFGCQTAIAVASMATEMLKGRTVEEARGMTAGDLSGPLGACWAWRRDWPGAPGCRHHRPRRGSHREARAVRRVPRLRARAR